MAVPSGVAQEPTRSLHRDGDCPSDRAAGHRAHIPRRPTETGTRRCSCRASCSSPHKVPTESRPAPAPENLADSSATKRGLAAPRLQQPESRSIRKSHRRAYEACAPTRPSLAATCAARLPGLTSHVLRTPCARPPDPPDRRPVDGSDRRNDPAHRRAAAPESRNSWENCRCPRSQPHAQLIRHLPVSTARHCQHARRRRSRTGKCRRKATANACRWVSCAEAFPISSMRCARCPLVTAAPDIRTARPDLARSGQCQVLAYSHRIMNFF